MVALYLKDCLLGIYSTFSLRDLSPVLSQICYLPNSTESRLSEKKTMADSVFTEDQWQALLALVDSVVPSVAVGESKTTNSNSIAITQVEFDEFYQQIRRKMTNPPTIEEFREYLSARPVDNPKFVGALKGTISNLPPTPVKQLGFILNVILYGITYFTFASYYILSK